MWTRIFKSKPKLSDSEYYEEQQQQQQPDQLQFTTPLCSYLEEFELENEERKERRYSLDSPTIFSIKQYSSENLNAESSSIELRPCPICSRKFNTTTYDKHVGICSTTASRKRKTFDSSRQRREGTDLASYLPKHFGLPASKIVDKPTSPRPAQIVHPLKKEELDSKIPQRHITSPKQSNSNATNFARGRSFRASKRTQPPAPEQCPHCERFFGTKAYDRHVEWCKEKALQKAIKNTGATNAAKERLQARTQYKAPSLRSKRTVTREKYSPSGNAEEDERMSQKSISLSLTSSFISDGGFSDKYDPFTSAKRQLEELCSPTLSTNSFFVESPLPQPPKVVSNPTKSGFRRALSLRSPRKASLLPSRPVFLPSYNYRSTVQRGLSDEGPISTNFLKTEEYDEMPVRSVCQNDFAITNTSRLIRRDSSASNRRDSSASSKRNMRLDLQKEPVSSSVLCPNPLDITKTDSLSIFLKHEKNTKEATFDSPLSAKDLKDKSNTISKQNSSKELSTEKPSTPKLEVNLHSVRLEPIDVAVNERTNLALNSGFGHKETNDFIDPKLINICDNLSVNVTKLSDSDITSESSTHSVKKDTMDATNCSNRSSTDGKNLRKRRILLDRNQFLFDAIPDYELVSYSSVRSNDRKVDSPSTPQLDDFDIEEFLSSFRSEEKDLPLFKGCHDFLSKRFNNNNNSNNNNDNDSNDNDNDSNDNVTMSNNSPLISSPTILHLNNNTKGNVSKRDEYGSEKGEIFISIETDHSENDFEHPAHDNPLADNQRTQVLMDDDITDNKFSRIEDENDKVRRNNERNLKEADSYHSIQEIENGNNIVVIEKRSVDSAYGSLSRQNNNIRKRNTSSLMTSRTRPTTAANPETISLHSKVREESLTNTFNHQSSKMMLSRDSSSGGSETSLPPINLSRQELESNISRRTTPSPSTGKLSKFCHECGSKFIVECAKFCMECGVKRIVL